MLKNKLLVASCVVASFLVLVAFSQDGDLDTYVPKNGYVPDKATAVQIAHAVLVPVCGKDVIDRELPFDAHLEKGHWVVMGTHWKGPEGTIFVGGVAEVWIDKKSGAIVRMTHGKLRANSPVIDCLPGASKWIGRGRYGF